MAGPLILCIDDEALGLQIRRAVLEKAGYRVLTALDGSSGLAICWENDADAVVLDYAMPGMNGGQVAEALRRERPDLPILLLSAYVSLPEELTGMVDATVVKGDGPERFLSVLDSMLALRAQSQRRTASGESA